MTAGLRYLSRRHYSHSPGKEDLAYRMQRASTPAKLQALCNREGHNFSEKHWRLTADCISAFIEKGFRHEILAVERDINLPLAASMRHRNFSFPTISHISWTYGKIGVKNPELIQLCKRHLERKICKEEELDDLTKAAWGFALFQDFDKPSLERIAEAVEIKIKEGSCLREDEFFRLNPISLAGRAKWKKEILGTETAARIHDYMQKRRFVIPNGSKLQREVSDWIIGSFPQSWLWETEYFLEGYHLDLSCPARRLAFEIDGPQHFYPGTREWKTRDHLMDHMLNGLGWKVARIAYWEWEEADSPEKKRELIASKNQDAGQNGKAPSTY